MHRTTGASAVSSEKLIEEAEYLPYEAQKAGLMTVTGAGGGFVIIAVCAG